MGIPSNERCLSRTIPISERSCSALSEGYLLLPTTCGRFAHSNRTHILRQFNQVATFKRRATTSADQVNFRILYLGCEGDHALAWIHDEVKLVVVGATNYMLCMCPESSAMAKRQSNVDTTQLVRLGLFTVRISTEARLTVTFQQKHGTWFIRPNLHWSLSDSHFGHTVTTLTAKRCPLRLFSARLVWPEGNACVGAYKAYNRRFTRQKEGNERGIEEDERRVGGMVRKE